jgi:hypothetical protein
LLHLGATLNPLLTLPPLGVRASTGGTVLPPLGVRASTGGTVLPPFGVRASTGGTVLPSRVCLPVPVPLRLPSRPPLSPLSRHPRCGLETGRGGRNGAFMRLCVRARVCVCVCVSACSITAPCLTAIDRLFKVKRRWCRQNSLATGLYHRNTHTALHVVFHIFLIPNSYFCFMV